MICTSIEQSKHLLELGLDPKAADMCWEMEKGNLLLNVGRKSAQVNRGFAIPAWSLSALLEMIPKPDLYRETADLWVCVTFFKEGSIRGFGETAIDAACDTITKMFGRGYLKKKGDNNE